MKKKIALTALLTAGLWGAVPAQEAQVAYPEGFRSWYHVKSMVIMPGHPLYDPFGGIHHVYANAKALRGLKTGNYEDGAVFVFDLWEYEEAGNALVEKQRKLIGVMERDSRRFAATGGWGFEGFGGGDPSKRLVTDGGQGCYSCHQQAKEKGYVFSEWRD